MNEDVKTLIYDATLVSIINYISNVTHGTDSIFGELNQNPVRFDIPNLMPDLGD